MRRENMDIEKLVQSDDSFDISGVGNYEIDENRRVEQSGMTRIEKNQKEDSNAFSDNYSESDDLLDNETWRSEIVETAIQGSMPLARLGATKPIGNENINTLSMATHSGSYIGKKVPPKLDCEVELVIPNFHEKYIANFKMVEREKIYSDWLELPNFKFRILLFTRNRCDPKLIQTAEKSFISAFVEAGKKDNWPDDWGFQSVDYQIVIINHFDTSKSSFNKDSFGFTSRDIDRGWHEILSYSAIQNNGFLDKNGSLWLRAGAFPHGCEYDKLSRDVIYNSREATGFVGLKNHGATCYMNALLQSLYQIGRFRRAVFEMKFTDDYVGKKSIAIIEKEMNKGTSDQSNEKFFSDAYAPSGNDHRNVLDHKQKQSSWNSTVATLEDLSTWSEEYRDLLIEEEEERKLQPPVSLALQNLFYRLYHSQDAVACEELLRSFGWDDADAFLQQDTHELLKLLLDKVEEQMRGTPAEGCVKQMFEGQSETYIECIDITYKSGVVETFEDIQLDVRGCSDIMQSLRKATEAEILDGENMYEAEGHGKHRARKGIRFLKFPPVVIFLLKRFDYDLKMMVTVKVNDYFEFYKEIDLSEFCPDAGEYVLQAVSVHYGDVNCGHYYAFCRDYVTDQWLKFDDEKVMRVSEFSALKDNFGGEEGEAWNYLSGSNSNHRRPKVNNAYILVYVKKDLVEDVLSTCPPSQVNPQLVERSLLLETIRGKRAQVRQLLQKNVKIKVFDRDSYKLKSFVDIPFQAWPARVVLNFARDQPVAWAMGQIEKELNKLNGVKAHTSYIFHSLMDSKCRFERLSISSTLKEFIRQVKDIFDPYDPTLYFLVIHEPRIPSACIMSSDVSSNQILLVIKYFDIFVPNPSEENLICLDFIHVKYDLHVGDLVLKVKAMIISAMERGDIKPHPDADVKSHFSVISDIELNCFLESRVNINANVIVAKKTLKNNGIRSGDILVWSCAPVIKDHKVVDAQKMIGRTPADFMDTSENGVLPIASHSSLEDNSVIVRDSIDVSAESSFGSTDWIPPYKWGYPDTTCPDLPVYPTFNFHDLIEKRRNSIDVSVRFYDVMEKLGMHQDLCGRILCSDQTISRHGSESEMSISHSHQDLIASLESDVTPRSSTGDWNNSDHDVYRSLKLRPSVIRTYRLDARMPCKQVIKRIAWEVCADPTHLVFTDQPPLLSVDTRFHHLDELKSDSRVGTGLSSKWRQLSLDEVLSSLKQYEGASYNIMHFTLLPNHYSMISRRQSSSLDSNSLCYVVQFMNAQVEVVGAHIGCVPKHFTVNEFLKHVRTFVTSKMEALGLSSVEPLRLVYSCPGRFDVYPLDMMFSKLSYWKKSNLFAYPLRVEPDTSDSIKQALKQRSLRSIIISDANDRDIIYRGHSFEVFVQPNATLTDIKAEVKNKLQLPKKIWDQFRGWYVQDSNSKCWRAYADDITSERADNGSVIVEYPRPYSRNKNQAAMRIA